VLVDDTWAGVLAGTVDAAAFLALAERFTDETDLSVWQRLTGGLSALERLLPADGHEPFVARVRSIAAPAYERLGAEPEPDEDDRARTLRGLLVTTLATVGNDEAVQSLCASRLDAYLDDPDVALDPNLALAALNTGATLGDRALHERLVARFESTANPQDRERVLFALARFRDADCLQRTLDLSLSGKVRTQDAPYLLRETIANRSNGATAWDFVASRWDEINERFPSNSIPRMVSGIRALRERSVADRVVAFLADHPIEQGALLIRQHIERMWVTVRLAERESERFAATLTSTG
jgi:puromycin-sensitive aminopeptidase